MARTGILLLLLAAVAAGVAAGVAGRRRSERPPLPPPRRRSPTLERALGAWEAGDGGATRRALDAFAALGEAPRDDVAEAALLRALLAGGDEALRKVQTTWAGTSAAGRAAWERVVHAPTRGEQQEALEAFRAAYPDAWAGGDTTRRRRR